MLGVRLAALAYIQLKAVYAAYQLAQLAEAEVARVKIGLLFYKQAAELTQGGVALLIRKVHNGIGKQRCDI